MTETRQMTALGILREVREEMDRLIEQREAGFTPNRKAVDKYVMEMLSQLTVTNVNANLPNDDGTPINSRQFGMIAIRVMRAYRKAMGDDK